MGIDRNKMAKSTEELKHLIAEHPDYPIVVLASEETNDGVHLWTYCTEISFGIAEILDTDFCDYHDTVFTDHDSLEEFIEDMLYDDYHKKSEEEYTAAIKAKMAELEPYWIKVIAIYADN